MKIKCILAGLALFCCISAQADNFNPSKTDTMAIRRAKWTVEKGAPAVTVKTAVINIFGTTARISVATMPIHRYRMRVALYDHDAKPLDEIGKETGAAVVLNGTYFRYGNTTSDRSTECFYSKGGTVYSTTEAYERSRTLGVLLFGRGGIRIQTADAGTDQSENSYAQKYEEVLAGGPILVTNGVRRHYNEHDGDGFYTDRHARTIIGCDRRGNVMMVTADNSGGGVGLTISEAGFVAEVLGMYDAINLDGGGSTALWCKDLGGVNSYNGGSGIFRWVPNAVIAY